MTPPDFRLFDMARRVENCVSHWPENGGVLRGSGRGGFNVRKTPDPPQLSLTLTSRTAFTNLITDTSPDQSDVSHYRYTFALGGGG